ncbi:hypothetical protein [Neobacillus drentensis]|uniref:hypothetical protein n=1 Tax=Neobacillus drentensis TaxID=220684 RepID=UPI002FFD8C4C
MSIQKAKELVFQAQELRSSRSAFLREAADSLRPEFTKIKMDTMLSPAGRHIKIKELKEQASKQFMNQVSLRKQAYQHYLNKAKKLAIETIEKSIVYADDATRSKFQREFSELKFKIALKDEKGAYNEIKSFVEKTPNPAYASLVMDNFYILADKFNAGEFKLGLSKTYDKLKSDFTPEEVAEAYDVIEHVDSSINDKMFLLMMPGDNPAVNTDYSIISELFTQDALCFYQEPEAYFAKQEDEVMPVFVDPDEEKVEVKKAPVDSEYAKMMQEIKELQERLQRPIE